MNTPINITDQLSTAIETHEIMGDGEAGRCRLLRDALAEIERAREAIGGTELNMDTRQLIADLKAGPLREGEAPGGIELFDIDASHETMYEAADALAAKDLEIARLREGLGVVKKIYDDWMLDDNYEAIPTLLKMVEGISAILNPEKPNV